MRDKSTDKSLVVGEMSRGITGSVAMDCGESQQQLHASNLHFKASISAMPSAHLPFRRENDKPVTELLQKM